ncbi:hypothetical protein [Salinivibrio kushneri]|uniref:hypothetical protein n=1 Tax=Salinivibrio kushneri TaxID=1908198 RepID=UPI0022B2C595|nr:hypothetical protein [Salinivibrio kushneri]WBA13405.1 hypothetical protein O4546_13800 [Salinivibrio kushneri]
MKNTFLNRVSAERRVLTLVNRHFSSVEELTGLSRAAILRWQVVVGFHSENRVVPLLFDLAEQCQRLSDRSNETFMPLEKAQAKKIEEQLGELKEELQRCR